MPFPEWTPPRVSDEPKEPGWGPAGDLRRSMEVLKHAPPTPQEQRIRELEAALRALTAVEPTMHVPQDYEDCVYCPASKPVYGPRWNDPFVHDPDCPWAKAKALTALPEAP